MSSNIDFKQLSYERHKKNRQEYAIGGREENLAKTWFNEDTVDAWCHKRMYSSLDPLLEIFRDSSWLTVGDGRYGSDAHYLQKKGLSVLATDISDALLKEGQEVGYIKAYRKENAESLSFSDDQFDFVFCKEAYHHFPRPMVALYEMLRVAKKAVVLIEPNDSYIATSFVHVVFRKIKELIKIVMQKEIVKHGFESVGNYCYKISKREIEKVALGLGYKAVAFKGIHSYYKEGIEFEKAAINSKLFKKIRRRIGLLNLFTQLRLQEYSVLTAIIFKETITPELKSALNNNSYEITILPDNPYV